MAFTQSRQVDVLEGFARLGLTQSQSQSPGAAHPDWIIPPEDLSVDSEVPMDTRSGAQMTFKGSWNGMVVAIKKLPSECSRQVIVEHVKRHRTLSSPYLLSILGASSASVDPAYMITPFLENGNITQYLARRPHSSRIQAVSEVALGMEYLHSMNVEHGRLKTANILVHDDGQACVADQGLYQLNNMPPSPSRYFSPEAWKGVVSKPSDVFAYAMVAYEILTSNAPWGFLSDTQMYQLVVRMGERPERPPANAPLPISDRDWSIVESAWHADPDARPLFTQITARLNARTAGGLIPEASGLLFHNGQRTASPSSVQAPREEARMSHFSYNVQPTPAELEVNIQPLNIRPTSADPPAPPAYVPNDDITTFRPSASTHRPQKSDSGLEHRPSSGLASPPPSHHDVFRSNTPLQSHQYGESIGYPYNASPSFAPVDYTSQPRRPESSASSSSASYYGIGPRPLPSTPSGSRSAPRSPPPDSARTTPSLLRKTPPSSAHHGSPRFDAPGYQPPMHRHYSNSSSSYGSPALPSTGLPPMQQLQTQYQHHSGYEIQRVPTSASTSSTSAPSAWGGSSASSYSPSLRSFPSPPPPPPPQMWSHERTSTAISTASAHSFTNDPSYFGMIAPSSPEEMQGPKAEDLQWRPTSKRFSQVDFGWQTIFDSNYNRIPVYAENWFKKDWEIAEIHEYHLLFKRKASDKHLFNVYTVKEKKMTILDLKSEPSAVGLSFHGLYMASVLGHSLNLIEVRSQKVLKRAKCSGGVRQWTSNLQGFCWVDSEGVFQQWSYGDREEPKQIFRLMSNAPNHWIRPMTTVDGSWYAICATDKDRTAGIVHCYPANNDPAQVFRGLSAGFVQVGIKTHAMATLNAGTEGGKPFFEMQVHFLGRTAFATEPRRVANDIHGKTLSRLWDDPGHSMVVAAVSTREDGFAAYVFDSSTGDLLCTHPITEDREERVYCGAGGLHLEKEGRTLKKLQLHPGGLVLDTSPMTMPEPVRSHNGLSDLQVLSSPSTTTLSPNPPLGRMDTTSSSTLSNGSDSKRKKSWWKIGSGSASRPDRIVSSQSSKSSTQAKASAFNSFGQDKAEDEDWMLQKR